MKLLKLLLDSVEKFNDKYEFLSTFIVIILICIVTLFFCYLLGETRTSNYYMDQSSYPYNSDIDYNN